MAIPICDILLPDALSQSMLVLGKDEILKRLRDKGVINARIAEVLNITPSRVTELYDGDRKLQLEEAVKLVREFDLEPPSPQIVSPLPVPILKMIVDHVALTLGVSLEGRQEELESLAEDLRAFSEFVTDPKIRESIDLAMAFFQAMRLRHPAPELKGRAKNAPHHAH